MCNGAFASAIGTSNGNRFSRPNVQADTGERLGTARPAVIVGGLAINRFNQLADAVGADASSTDAQAAVDSAQRIMVKQDG